MNHELATIEALAVYDSEEDEIFFGPITARELELRARRKLTRRTIGLHGESVNQSRNSPNGLTADLTAAVAASTSASNVDSAYESLVSVGYVAPPPTPEAKAVCSRHLKTCHEDEDLREHSYINIGGLETSLTACIQVLPTPESSGDADISGIEPLLQSIPLIAGLSDISESVSGEASVTTACLPLLYSVSNNLKEKQLNCMPSPASKKQDIDNYVRDDGSEETTSQEDVLDICLNQQEVGDLDTTDHSIEDPDAAVGEAFLPEIKTTDEGDTLGKRVCRYEQDDTDFTKVIKEEALDVKMVQQEDVLDICLSHQEDSELDALNNSELSAEDICDFDSLLPSRASFVTLRNKKYSCFRRSSTEEESSSSENSRWSILTSMDDDLIVNERKSYQETIHEVNESLGNESLCDVVNSPSHEVNIPTGYMIQKDESLCDVVNSPSHEVNIPTGYMIQKDESLSDLVNSPSHQVNIPTGYMIQKDNIFENNCQENLLMQTLQRRFHKQVAEIPTSLADLSLDETCNDLASNNNCEQSMNEFLANEAACSSICADGTMIADVSGVSELQVSTVSADEDGGFLTGFTELALYHAAKYAEPKADFSQTSVGTVHTNAIGICDKSADTQSTDPFPSLDEDNTLHLLDVITHYEMINSMQSQTFDSDISDYKEVEGTENANMSCSIEQTEQFNDTLDDMEMLETFGLQYMLSGKDEDYSKVGADIDGSFNQLLITKEQQELLNSFTEERASAQKPTYHYMVNSPVNRSETARNISMSFAPQTTTSSLASTTANVTHNVPAFPSAKTTANIPSNDQVGMEFKFPKPISTVTKAKYQHETTPIKSSVPTKTQGRFFPHPSKTPEMPNANARATPSRIPNMSPNFKKPKYFGKIESPVGAYIHNSPASLICNKNSLQADTGKIRNIFPDVVTNQMVYHQSNENVDTSNLHSIIPVVAYKSTGLLKLDEPAKSYLPHLDEKMKRLIDKPRLQVIKHTGRVRESDLPDGSPVVRQSPLRSARHDLADDSCLMSDAACDTSRDVSVVVSKDAGRTNTLPR